MDHSEKFSDYLFAKMGPPIIGTMDTECPQKTTDNCDAPPFEFTGFRKWLNENLMLLITLSGVLLGVILGFSLRPLNLTEDSIMLISYPGELFMRLLKLMILPLVISSLIAGSASLNARMNGRIALRTLIYFASTSFFNALLGICLVLLISPGTLDDKRLPTDSSQSTPPTIAQTSTTNLLDSLLDLGRNVFPDNLFQASFQQAHTVYVKNPAVKMLNTTKMENISTSTISPLVQLFVTSSTTTDNLTSIINSTIKPIIEYITPSTPPPSSSSSSSSPSSQQNVIHQPEMIRQLQYRPGTNTLGIVFFCLVFGTLLGTIGNKGQVVVDFFTAVFDVVMKMVTSVMWLTPLGISSVIAGKILSVADLATVMSQLMWFIITVAIGVFFYQLIVMQLIYFVFLRRNPFKFYCGLIYPMLTAFATASTAAALPVTFRCMHDKLKIDQRITRFVLPIGCNINMDGTALFIAVASIFIAQMSGMELGLGELVTVLLTSTATSMSSASVPSAALVLLLVVLSAIDAPVHNVTLLFAIDWFVDRIRTTNNMLGDCYAAAVVEELSKKELMALDASILYPDTPVTPNGHCLINCQSSDLDRKVSLPDSVIVEMNNSNNINSNSSNNNNNNNNIGNIQHCCVTSGQCNTIIIGPSPSTTLGSSSAIKQQPSQSFLSSSSSSGLSLQTTTTTTTTTSTINGGIPSVGMGNMAKIQTINK